VASSEAIKMDRICEGLNVREKKMKFIAAFLMILISSNIDAWARILPEKINIETFTCKEGWGAKTCEPHKMKVDLYVPNAKDVFPLVVLQHGSTGVNNAVLDKIDLLIKNKYAVVIIDGFTSRGISKSHFDYAAAASKGGNGRTMTLDVLSAIKALSNDKRIDVELSSPQFMYQ